MLHINIQKSTNDFVPFCWSFKILHYLLQDFVDDLVELLVLDFVEDLQAFARELVLEFVLADLLALAIFYLLLQFFCNLPKLNKLDL